jgi:hypothetical protein
MAVTPTYVALGTVTLGSSQQYVTFSSIPATYRDLIVVFNGGINSDNKGIEIVFNSDTSNQSQVFMYAQGASPESGTSSSMFFVTDGSNSNAIIQIMDYSATDKHKTALIRSAQNITSGVWAHAGRWASLSAVNSVRIGDVAGATIDSGSTLSIYGIH